MAGLFEPPSIFLGVTDGAIMIQLTGFPIFIIFHLNNRSKKEEEEKEEDKYVQKLQNKKKIRSKITIPFRIKQVDK